MSEGYRCCIKIKKYYCEKGTKYKNVEIGGYIGAYLQLTLPRVIN